MGIAYLALGDRTRAEACYRAALGADGFDPKTHEKFFAFTNKLLAELPRAEAEPYSFAKPA
jgi:hypothetical protein